MLLNSDHFDKQVLDLVNQERAKVGVDPLSIDIALDQAADLHAEDQATIDYMTHFSSDGGNLVDRVDRTGYEFSSIAENVSQVALDPETVMYGGIGFDGIRIVGWMDSPGHRNNILDPDLEDIGIGFDRSSDGSPYWTQVFGDPSS
jgi:uncharacterized protein YkwD